MAELLSVWPIIFMNINLLNVIIGSRNGFVPSAPSHLLNQWWHLMGVFKKERSQNEFNQNMTNTSCYVIYELPGLVGL